MMMSELFKLSHQSTISYHIDYDEKTKIYTGFCPSIRPVRFSDKNKAKVKELVEDGINLYMQKKLLKNESDIARSLSYHIDYDEKTKIYTGFCPSIRPVRFSDKNESKVKELVEDGINLYLQKELEDEIDKSLWTDRDKELYRKYEKAARCGKITFSRIL